MVELGNWKHLVSTCSACSLKTRYGRPVDGQRAAEGGLHATLAREEVETLVITGGETDVCVLAAVVGAVDLGYRVVLLSYGACSGEDATHDASLKLLGDRFSVQLDLQPTEEFLRNVFG
ncbi:hypothetical protein ASC96_27785 [Rhizobium sp. Root1204]|nr:hypothetical protein ASC96_27785 [Rhizobium sp. Root1204]